MSITPASYPVRLAGRNEIIAHIQGELPWEKLVRLG
jgi:hypothetical protein